MDVIYPPEHMGRSQVQFGDAGISTATPVPSRYSSAMCPCWTDLSAMMAPKVSGETYALNLSADDDAYLQALKQMSATHRPSLDDLPLDRSTATALQSVPSGKTVQQERQAESLSKQPRPTGRRYHKLADGRVYLEVVDVSAHQNHNQSSVNKVRPASGTLPFTTMTDATGAALRSKAEQDIELYPTAVAASGARGDKGREGGKRKWAVMWRHPTPKL